MGTTAYHDLPYPEGTDLPMVHLDLRALAESVDEDLPIVAPDGPPHRDGRLWITDGSVRLSDADQWRAIAGRPDAVPFTYDPVYRAYPGAVFRSLQLTRLGRRVFVEGIFTNAQAFIAGNGPQAAVQYTLATGIPAAYRPAGGRRANMVGVAQVGAGYMAPMRVDVGETGGMSFAVAQTIATAVPVDGLVAIVNGSYLTD